MDAAVLRVRPNSLRGQTYIAEPTQSFRVSRSIGDALRLEVPFSLLMVRSSGHDAVTEVRTGLLVDVFPARFADEGRSADQSGLFVGGGLLVDYLNVADVTRKGITARTGYEFALEDIHLRIAALYEQLFKDGSTPRAQQYGGSLGISFPVAGQETATRRQSSEPGKWYVQAKGGINRSRDNGSPTTTTVWLPKPFFSVFYFPGSQRRAAVGVRTHAEYLRNDAYSNRYIQLAPRAEFNVLPHSGSRTGVQVGAHAIIDNMSARSPSLSYTSNYFGAGADVSVTLPVMPTMWKIGLGFDVDAAGGKPRRPSGTNLRLDIAVDRFLSRKAG